MKTMKVRFSRGVSLVSFLIAMCLSGCSPDPTPKEIAEKISGAPDAGGYIVDVIRDGKIVFLSEAHDKINPILFLARNIDRFYDAGVRYVFFEGGLTALPESPEYNFPQFFPWTSAGWKYEEVVLAQSIERLNSRLDDSKKLRILIAEEGLVSNDLNERDSYASSRIITVMDASDAGDKALVFYGGSHGSKTVFRDAAIGDKRHYDWKPLGVYLADYYGPRFSSIGFTTLSSQGLDTRVPSSDWESYRDIQKIILPKDVAGTPLAREFDRYDAFLVERDNVFGTFYQYVPSDINMRYLFDHLNYCERNIDDVKVANRMYRFDNQGKYLMDIYYLKLYFGECFPYTYWNPETTLISALDTMRSTVFADGKHIADSIMIDVKSAECLREYHRYMRESGLEGYLIDGNPQSLPTIEEKMAQASRLFPEDLWTQYWIGFARYQSKNFTGAIDALKSLVDNPLARCMEVYPSMLEMLSASARETGDATGSSEYAAMVSTLTSEHSLDLSGYIDTNLLQ